MAKKLSKEERKAMARKALEDRAKQPKKDLAPALQNLIQTPRTYADTSSVASTADEVRNFEPHF